MQEPTGQQEQVFVSLTWPLAQLLRLLQATFPVLLTKHCRLIFRLYEEKGLILPLFFEKVDFQQDNIFHSKHGYNILDISGICLRLVTFHIDTLKGVRIHSAKQKCPFSSLLHNKFGLYKKKAFLHTKQFALLNYTAIKELWYASVQFFSSGTVFLSINISFQRLFNFSSAYHLQNLKNEIWIRKTLGELVSSLQKRLMI